MKSWQLQEAKAHLSQVVQEVMKNGPQEISLRGKPAVILISKQEYDNLTQPKLSFVQFMRQSPLVTTPLQFKRDRSLTRETDL